MGMFDTIIINTDLLPISEEEKELLSKTNFQTKSLDNALFTYRITNDGFLEYLVSSRNFGIKESFSPETDHWKRINDIHGYVSFYTSSRKNNEWFEFVAKFTDGKLVEIFRNQGHRYEGNRKDDY
jgi:hypothetical protein